MLNLQLIKPKRSEDSPTFLELAEIPILVQNLLSQSISFDEFNELAYIFLLKNCSLLLIQHLSHPQHRHDQNSAQNSLSSR